MREFLLNVRETNIISPHVGTTEILFKRKNINILNTTQFKPINIAGISIYDSYEVILFEK